MSGPVAPRVDPYAQRAALKVTPRPLRARDVTIGRDGTAKVRGGEVAKVTKTAKGYESTVNGKTVRSKTQSGLKSGIAKQLSTPTITRAGMRARSERANVAEAQRLSNPNIRELNRAQTAHELKTKQPALKSSFAPRKLTKLQAQNEMDEAIRDSENHGYEPSRTEAREFVRAFRKVQETGTEQRYHRDVDRDEPRGLVTPGDKAWYTKLDYEVSFPADAVAVWVDDPLT